MSQSPAVKTKTRAQTQRRLSNVAVPLLDNVDYVIILEHLREVGNCPELVPFLPPGPFPESSYGKLLFSTMGVALCCPEGFHLVPYAVQATGSRHQELWSKSAINLQMSPI